MIRDKRTFIAVNAIGGLAALLTVVLQCLYPATQPLLRWIMVGGGILLAAQFVSNIVLRMRGPIQPARWARNLTDGQLWIVKGIAMACAAGIAAAFALRVVLRKSFEADG